MANYQALDLSAVQAVKKIIVRDIIEEAALVDNSVFDFLGFNVLEDVENQQSIFVGKKNHNVAAGYTPGDTLNRTLGATIERMVIVKPYWSRVQDNLENYREKEPFSIADLHAGGAVKAAKTEYNLRLLAEEIAEQSLLNVVFGDVTKGKQSMYGLFNGLLKAIADDKTAGNISAANGNLITTDPMTGTDEDCYDNIVEFYQALDPRLRGREDLMIYISKGLYLKAVRGYLHKYEGLQDPAVGKEGYRFVEMPNVLFKPHAIFGNGDLLIATVPNNITFASDCATDKALANVMQDPEDAKVIILQVDLAAGVRIDNPFAHRFAVNNGTLTPTYAEAQGSGSGSGSGSGE